LVEEAHQVNMNMLRVWGGGIYPPNEFFAACDNLGILVWQDFMFACSMYPWDNNFIENVTQEANEQIHRMRRYSSLALLCGNNEIEEGWHNWGWQHELADSLQIKQVWDGYNHLFHNVLPDLVNTHDSLIPYWPSSPQYGWGKEESLKHGDSHYWGVWWGKEPFDIFKEKVPRFMSEYGFQSYPTLETVKHFGNGEPLPDSSQVNCHQKHPTGFETINHYLEKKGWSPKNIEQNIYLSQVHQAMGYQMAIETHRMAAPRTMGTLYWQLNDCWPAISWSTIDFAEEWKASHYQVKRSYSPILVVPTIEKNRLYVSIVSDLPEETEGLLTIIVYDATGKKLGIWKDYVTKITSTPRRVFRTELYLETDEEVDIPLIAHTEFVVDWYDSYYGCTANFDCTDFQYIKVPKIKHRVIPERGNTYIELTTNKPAMFVEINNPEGNLKLSDNYFHLLPKVKYRVKVIEGDVENLLIKSLIDYLDKDEE
jgi:beta-mannosidase